MFNEYKLNLKRGSKSFVGGKHENITDLVGNLFSTIDVFSIYNFN